MYVLCIHIYTQRHKDKQIRWIKTVYGNNTRKIDKKHLRSFCEMSQLLHKKQNYRQRQQPIHWTAAIHSIMCARMTALQQINAYYIQQCVFFSVLIEPIHTIRIRNCNEWQKKCDCKNETEPQTQTKTAINVPLISRALHHRVHWRLSLRAYNWW